MCKYFLFRLLALLNIAALQAVDVEMQAAGAMKPVVPSVTATQICERILGATPLVGLPPESIPVERLKRWSRESVIASLYYYAVTAVESVNPTHDMNQAKAWYAKAALVGEPYAFYRLALILIKRENQETVGLILMQAAADKDYYDARVYLGLEKEDY